MAKSRKRNTNHKWHKHQRGGKRFAERRGIDLKIQKITKSATGRAHIVAYDGNKRFSSFWFSGIERLRRVKRETP